MLASRLKPFGLVYSKKDERIIYELKLSEDKKQIIISLKFEGKLRVRVYKNPEADSVMLPVNISYQASLDIAPGSNLELQGADDAVTGASSAAAEGSRADPCFKVDHIQVDAQTANLLQFADLPVALAPLVDRKCLTDNYLAERQGDSLTPIVGTLVQATDGMVQYDSGSQEIPNTVDVREIVSATNALRATKRFTQGTTDAARYMADIDMHSRFSRSKLIRNIMIGALVVGVGVGLLVLTSGAVAVPAVLAFVAIHAGLFQGLGLALSVMPAILGAASKRSISTVPFADQAPMNKVLAQNESSSGALRPNSPSQ